jgi:hypothetical protein
MGGASILKSCGMPQERNGGLAVGLGVSYLIDGLAKGP